MKRIAALAALAITLLAVARCGGHGLHRRLCTWLRGSRLRASRAGPGRLPAAIPRPQGNHQIQADARARLVRNRHGKPVPIRLSCPDIPAKPLPRGCKPQVLRFDMAAGSSTLTEVSGPVLAPPQEFSYDGNTYTIMSVNPAPTAHRLPQRLAVR